MVNFYNQKNREVSAAELATKKSGAANQVKTKATADKYIDVTGEFGAEQFKLSVWLVRYKLFFYRLGVAILVAISTVMIIFSLWNGFKILYYDLVIRPNLEKELATSVDYTALRLHFSPKALDLLNTSVLSSGKDKIDVISELNNQNERYLVNFSYHYEFDGQKTKTRDSFLLPNESRPVAEFGLERSVFFGAPALVLENIKFTRINPHDIFDVLNWQAERLRFEVNDFTYEAESLDKQSANAIRFNFKNSSAFGYKNPWFILELWQNGGVVGAMPFEVKDFQAGETRAIDLRNFTENLVVSEVKIYPVIDLFEKEVYLPVSAN